MLHVLKKNQGLMLPLLALLGLLFAVVTVFGVHESAIKPPVVSPPISPYRASIAGIGVVEPKSEIINIGTELSGVVHKVFVKVGDCVQAGDPLFMLDQRDIDAQINIQQALLAAAIIQAKDANAQFALVKGAQDSRAIARDDYNRRQYNAAYMAAKVEEAQAQLQLAETTKQRLTVRAPIRGEVLSINVRPGEFAQAGSANEPLMRIGDLTTRHVRVEFDEENAHAISPNAVSTGYLRGDPKHLIRLKFVRIEPYVRPKQNLALAGQRVDTRVLQVIYALPDTSTAPFVGQQLDVYTQNNLVDQP